MSKCQNAIHITRLLYLFINSNCDFPNSYLGLFLLCGIENGGAAHLSKFAAVTIEGPAADLVSDYIFDEEDAAVEAERQPVEELDVLQQVVV